MKKSLVLMAMAGVALAGCVNDVADVAQKEQKKAIIGFDSPVLYDNSESRANVTGELGANYDTGESFQIFASKYTGAYSGWTGSASFNDKTVNYIETLNGWAPLQVDGSYYYWQPDQKLAYAACSPAELSVAGASRSYGENGLTITGFTVQRDPAEQYDLLFSKRVYDATPSNYKTTGYTGLGIEFKHALSSIHFSLENQTIDTDVEVELTLKKIEVANVYDTGNFAENLRETQVDGNYVYEVGTDGNVHPSWTVSKTTSNTYIAYEAGTEPLEFPEAPFHLLEYINQKLKKNDTDPSNDLDYDYGTVYPLLLLPQELSADAEIIITYAIDNDVKEPKHLKLKDLKSGTTTISSWEMGHKYVYNLVYSIASAKADKIIFSPSVEDWGTEIPISVEIK